MTISLGPTGQLNQVEVGAFTTEAGVTLPAVTIAYHRWGNPNGNNIILLEHALTGDSDAATWWEGLIGPGRPFDTDRFCIICTNALGSCYGSTGPSSPHPQDGQPWGSRFPGISIRDMVKAEQQALAQLGITKLLAVIGGSMGGARTLEWEMMFPKLVDYALVIAVSARASAWQIGIQSAQIQAITGDPCWYGGNYHAHGVVPAAGLGIARRIAHLTYRGELEIDERFGADPQRGENPHGAYRDQHQRFAVESYLDYQAQKLINRFDAGCYVALTDALNRHDIGLGRGGLNQALAKCPIPTMIVGVDTDILYPYHQQEHLSRNIGHLLGMAKISSPVGHDAFLTEVRQMARIIRRFFSLAGID